MATWSQSMRDRLVDALEGLADRNYQQRVWIDRRLPNDVDDDGFDYVVHFLFDDTELSRDIEGCVGWFLKEEEVEPVRRVVSLVDAVIDRVGVGASDAEYVDSPYWPEIVSAAAQALGVVKRGG